MNVRKNNKVLTLYHMHLRKINYFRSRFLFDPEISLHLFII